MIYPDGTVHGLSLDGNNPMLLVRNYSGGIPIHVEQGMALSQSGSLVLAFDGNPWRSTISFDPGIPITLGGRLELDIVGGVGEGNLTGKGIQLFDWTGVSPSGQFASIGSNVASNCHWDTSQLYTTGYVTLIPEPGSLSLLGVGGLTLLGCARRRRRNWRVSD